MGSVSEFFSNIYTTTVVFFSLLLIESVILIRSIARATWRSRKHPISKVPYLTLVEENHPTIVYSAGSRSESIECAVCLFKIEEGEQIRELECNHVFHKDCVDRWLEHDWATCPLCRRSVLPEEIVSEHRRLVSQQDNEGDEELVFLLSALHGTNFHRLL